MKKLLTLLSLTTAITAFGAPQGNIEESATMNIHAIVIKPLTVKAESMEFERVIQGTTAIATGKYIIKGEPGQKITVSIEKPNELTNSENGIALPINLTYDAPINTNQSGDASFDINGSIAPSNEHLGTYTGKIIAKVQYQ